jgi:sensitive to high expression protein 9
MTNDSDSRPPLSPHDLDIKARIWEWTKQVSINLRYCADDFTAKSKSTFSQLGGWLNQITGYEEIEALKKGVVKQGTL